MRKFYSKILLFGEYSVLTSSDALILPFRKFYGGLIFGSREEAWTSNKELRGLHEYLTGNVDPGKLLIDLDKLSEDIEKGIYFSSTIPEKYGLGSSGALIAAVFHRYGKAEIKALDIMKLKEHLAMAESFFHGTSSGTDPLSIFLGSGLIIKPDRVDLLSSETMEETLQDVYLFDTGTASGTGEFISYFLSDLDSAYFRHDYKKYESEVNNAIESVLANENVSLKQSMKIISGYQLQHFKALIPSWLTSIWARGLDTSEYYFKLCGSGGGGFMLLLGNKPRKELERDLRTSLIPVANYMRIING